MFTIPCVLGKFQKGKPAKRRRVTRPLAELMAMASTREASDQPTPNFIPVDAETGKYRGL